MHPQQEIFFENLKEVGELHLKKNKDYGSKDDPFANVRAAEDFGIAAWLGAMIRLNDKVIRLKNYALTGNMANESARDSLLDIMSYANIALVLLEEETKEKVTHLAPIK